MHWRNKETTIFCGAKNRKGQPCRHLAGWGTDHVGAGRCKNHGGASPSGPASASFKHGRYAYVFHGKLEEKFRQALDVPDPLDLLPELAVHRTLLMDYLDRFQEGMSLRGRDLQIISMLTNDVVNTATKIVKARNETALTVAEVKFLQAGIVALLDEYLPDPDQRRSFLTRLTALIPGPALAEVAQEGD